MSQYFKHQDQQISVGDTVDVYQQIKEGSKTRIQIFEGIVIAVKGREAGTTFTVRKLGVGGVGVEKIFPLRLPSIEKIVVKRRGQVRRSKLYYLRERVGKAASKVKEKSVVAPTTAAA